MIALIFWLFAHLGPMDVGEQRAGNQSIAGTITCSRAHTATCPRAE